MFLCFALRLRLLDLDDNESSCRYTDQISVLVGQKLSKHRDPEIQVSNLIARTTALSREERLKG